MRRLVRFCLGFLSGISLVLTAFLFLGADRLMGLFVEDASMIESGTVMLRWQTITAVFAGIVLLITVLFQATGKILPSFLMSISRQGVIFLAALFVCRALFQYNGILMAQAAADVVSAVLALFLLIKNKEILTNA